MEYHLKFGIYLTTCLPAGPCSPTKMDFEVQFTYLQKSSCLS